MNKRLSERIPCYGKILADNIPGHLRDIHSMGCKITTMAPLGASKNDEISLEMIPDSDTGIGASRFSGKIRWSEIRSGYYYYGVLVLRFDSEESMKNFGRMNSLYGS